MPRLQKHKALFWEHYCPDSLNIENVNSCLWKVLYSEVVFVKQRTRMCRSRDDQKMTRTYHHSPETLKHPPTPPEPPPAHSLHNARQGRFRITSYSSVKVRQTATKKANKHNDRTSVEQGEGEVNLRPQLFLCSSSLLSCPLEVILPAECNKDITDRCCSRGTEALNYHHLFPRSLHVLVHKTSIKGHILTVRLCVGLPLIPSSCAVGQCLLQCLLQRVSETNLLSCIFSSVFFWTCLCKSSDVTVFGHAYGAAL